MYEAYRQLAMLYHTKDLSGADGNTEWHRLALENLDKASAALPRKSFVHFSQGKYYETLGQDREALRYFRSAVDLLREGTLEVSLEDMQESGRSAEKLRDFYEEAIRKTEERIKERSVSTDPEPAGDGR